MRDAAYDVALSRSTTDDNAGIPAFFMLCGDLRTHRRHVPILPALRRAPDPLPFIDLAGGHVEESAWRSRQQDDVKPTESNRQLVFALLYASGSVWWPHENMPALILRIYHQSILHKHALEFVAFGGRLPPIGP